jgi:hypothetical protein
MLQLIQDSITRTACETGVTAAVVKACRLQLHLLDQFTPVSRMCSCGLQASQLHQALTWRSIMCTTVSLPPVCASTA